MSGVGVRCRNIQLKVNWIQLTFIKNEDISVFEAAYRTISVDILFLISCIVSPSDPPLAAIGLLVAIELNTVERYELCSGLQEMLLLCLRGV